MTDECDAIKTVSATIQDFLNIFLFFNTLVFIAQGFIQALCQNSIFGRLLLTQLVGQSAKI